MRICDKCEKKIIGVPSSNIAIQKWGIHGELIGQLNHELCDSCTDKIIKFINSYEVKDMK